MAPDAAATTGAAGIAALLGEGVSRNTGPSSPLSSCTRACAMSVAVQASSKMHSRARVGRVVVVVVVAIALGLGTLQGSWSLLTSQRQGCVAVWWFARQPVLGVEIVEVRDVGKAHSGFEG